MKLVFDPASIQSKLKPSWICILDEEYIELNLIAHIKKTVAQSRELLDEFVLLAEKGHVLTKTCKESTKQVPFLLTVPNTRKVPLPEHVITTKIKANSIPKALFEADRMKMKLDKIKENNKVKSRKAYDISQTKVFQAAKGHGNSDKVERLREELKQRETDAIEKTRVVLKPVPNFKDAPEAKMTIAEILRLEFLMKRQLDYEKRNWIDMEIGLNDPEELAKLEQELLRKARDEETTKVMERKKQIQLHHQETIKAKAIVIKDNREAALELSEIKKQNILANHDQRYQLIKSNQKKVEIIKKIKQNISKARDRVVIAKTENAYQIAESNKLYRKQNQEKKEKDRHQKQILIHKIKELDRLAFESKKSSKDFDNTETSGAGLLGEMSNMEVLSGLIVAEGTTFANSTRNLPF